MTPERALQLLREVAEGAPTKELREAASWVIGRLYELEGSLDDCHRKHHWLCPTYYLPDRICTCGARVTNEVIDQALRDRASPPAKVLSAPETIDADWDLYT